VATYQHKDVQLFEKAVDAVQYIERIYAPASENRSQE
jgi:hypothetical protein